VLEGCWAVGLVIFGVFFWFFIFLFLGFFILGALA
jgi:hypothetical protein